MLRYKLVKPLPRAKAGDLFHLSSKGNLVHDDSGVAFYTKGELNKWPEILSNWFEKIPEQPKTVDDLGEGDEGWFIYGGVVKKYACMDIVELKCFKEMVAVGDGYLTKEEAEKELARCKAKVILEHDTKGFEPTYKQRRTINEWVYEVNYNFLRQCLEVYACRPYLLKGSDLLFATEADALASVESHEKEWKTYLGVED